MGHEPPAAKSLPSTDLTEALRGDFLQMVTSGPVTDPLSPLSWSHFFTDHDLGPKCIFEIFNAERCNCFTIMDTFRFLFFTSGYQESPANNAFLL